VNKDDYKAVFAQVQSVHSTNQDKLEVIMSHKTKHKVNRKPILVLAAVLLAALLSVSAYAIVTLLSPAEVAREAGHDALAEIFENGKGTVINETVKSKDYIFTLMGMTAGENLGEYGLVCTEKTALVVSIRRADGTPLDTMEGFAGQFGSGVFFSGYKPWQVSSFMLGMGGSAFDRDGVLYLVLEIGSDIEMFADRIANYAIWATGGDIGFAPGAEVLRMEEDGTISFTDGLTVAHAMFTLPLDPAKADPARVLQVLEERGFTEEDIAFMQGQD